MDCLEKKILADTKVYSSIVSNMGQVNHIVVMCARLFVYVKNSYTLKSGCEISSGISFLLKYPEIIALLHDNLTVPLAICAVMGADGRKF